MIDERFSLLFFLLQIVGITVAIRGKAVLLGIVFTA